MKTYFFRKYNFICLKILSILILASFLLTIANTVNATETNDEIPRTYSNNIIVMDYDSSAILYSKNAYQKVYPASTTKILTAIIVIEELQLSSPVVATKSAINSVPYGSSVSGIKVGEILSVENLLYCLMLESGNDASNVLAEAVSGSTKKFVEKMNEKLKQIGAKNTLFSNAHGFHDEDHYTTPYDMALVMQYAMRSETFRRFVETKKITIPKTNLTDEVRILKTTDKLILTKEDSSKSMFYEYALGGKTGYTDEARGTFVGYAKKGNSLIIVGVFDGSLNVSGKEARFIDSKNIYEYTFNNYKKKLVVNEEATRFSIYDEKNFKEYVIEIPRDIYSLSKSDQRKYFYDISLDLLNIQDLKEAMAKDTEIDENKIVLDYSIFEDGMSLRSQSSLKLVEVKNYFTPKILLDIILHNYIFIISYFVILILIIFIYFNIGKNKEKNFYKIQEKESIKSNKKAGDRKFKNRMKKEDISSGRKTRRIRNVRK